MQIEMTNKQVQEAFGELRYVGADYCYHYDKGGKARTDEIEAVKLHLGSAKLGNSIDIRLEAKEMPQIAPFSVVEIEGTVYSPYVQRGNYPKLIERFSCKGIHAVAIKNV